MKEKLFLLSTILLVVSCISAQKTVRMDAIKANDYGVVYSLPKTSLVVTLEVKKTTYQRGDFYQYAQRYLSISEPIIENHTEYTLEDISVVNQGIPDKTNSFMVEFRSNTVAPYVYLTEDGLLCSINAEAQLAPHVLKGYPSQSEISLNARRFFSEETLMAGSTAKQAELVAKQIFDLRRSRNDILTGEAENMPPDGNAYKLVMEQLNAQEKALTEMFSGKEQTEFIVKEIRVIPEENSIDRKVVARFSQKLGLLDSDNLAGEPIYLSLKNKMPLPATELSDKDRQRFEKKLSEGIVYNIPGKAELVIEFRNNVVKHMETDVVQFGTQDVLVKKMFDSRKQPVKVIFYPELGAIKQIIQ